MKSKPKKAKLKGVGAGKAKAKAKSSLQGADLPVDGSPLAMYPIGCCVFVALAGQDPAWHIVSFRIGRSGNPHCARLASDPSREGWNARMGDARETREDTIVHVSCWPFRASIDEGAEIDPIALQSDRSAAGSMSVSHLRGIP